MKILSLRLKNINSFREDILLDFTREPLHTAALFAITGPTGSGKTTLLDAISVALYNKTPRLYGKGNKAQVNLLSMGTDEGFSEVVFQVNGTRYLAEWRAKRKQNGKIEPSVKLINAASNELITSRRGGRNARDMADMSVEEAVTRILGMDFDAFKRSILLAQGEFASFLKADAEKKREILEATTGMDQYEQLKEILNLKIRLVTDEFGKREAALGAIPTASPEEIEMAQGELAGLEAELKELALRKAELDREKEKEQLRVESHATLEANRKRQLELTSRKGEMDELTAEVERAYKAANIRSELDSYLADTRQLEEVRVLRGNAGKELENTRSRFEMARAEYQHASRSYETARLEATERQKVYDQAAVHETEGKKLIQEAVKKKDEAAALDQKIKQQQLLISQKQNDIVSLEGSAVTDRSFIEQHPLPDNVENLLAQASEIAARLASREETLEQITAAQRKTEAGSLNEKLAVIAREKALLEARKQEQQDLLAENGRALEPFIGEGDEVYWHAVRSAWQDVLNTGGELPDSYDRLVSGITHPDIITTLTSFKSRMERADLEITAAREQVKRCQAEEELAVVRIQAYVLRQEHLRAGEPCPVCGSMDHPAAGVPDPDTGDLIETARRNVETAGSDLESVQQARVAAGRELAGVARDRITACDETIRNIESLGRRSVTIRNELDMLDERMRGLDSQEDSLNHQIRELEQERADLLAKKEGLVKEIGEHRAALVALIPGHAETAVERFKTVIRSVREAQQRLETTTRMLAEQKVSVQAMEKHVAEDVDRYENLLDEYRQYQQDGDALMGQVMEATGNLGVEAARSALDRELKNGETAREEKRSLYDAVQTELAGIRSKVEGLDADLQRLSQRSGAARARYVSVLENAGFGSMEDHRAAFRDPVVLEGKKKILEQYWQDIHTVTETIQTLQAIFIEHPFDRDAIQVIRQKELELDASIDGKNTNKGSITRKITTLQENLDKRQEQEHLLEDARKEMERWQNLASVMPANSFRDFALQTMFDLLVQFANQQLAEITSRYALKAVGMKDMVVIDRWNAGEERPVETLSGGESFLVSLSLALALSELSSGRTQLESLFLDEGFGTLDPETLDDAVSALEGLRLTGRTVGVISHIDQLTRRIPVRIEVKKKGNGSSKIEVKG